MEYFYDTISESARLVQRYVPQSDLFKLSDSVRLFVDLKNVMRYTFLEEVKKHIVENSSIIGNKFIDTSILQSTVYYLYLWKVYLKSHGVKQIQFIVFTDTGTTNYHTSILKGYKISRGVSKKLIQERVELVNSDDIPDQIKSRYISVAQKAMSITEKYDSELETKYKVIRDNNFEVAKNLLQKISNVVFLKLKFLETDFLPYYLLTRYFKNDDSTSNIICSNDHDIYQTLLNKNIYQYYVTTYRRNVKYIVLNCDNVIDYFLYGLSKSANTPVNNILTVRDLPVIYGLSGDPGDDIQRPVEFFAERSVVDMLVENREVTQKLIGTYDELDDRISNGGKFFKDLSILNSLDCNSLWRSYFLRSKMDPEQLNDYVTKVYKLVSFEQLSRWLDLEDSLFKIQTKREIISSLDNRKNVISNEAQSDSVYDVLIKSFGYFVLTREQWNFLTC